MSFLEYISFPEVFPFEKLKNKIYDIFVVKNNKDLYDYLLKEINDLYYNEKLNKHTNEESELRIHFYLIIEQINQYMTPSILHVDNDINKKSLDFFKKYIIKDNIINKHILISYIGVFDLHLLLKDYYSINKKIFYR